MYPTTQPICVHMSSNVRACMSLPACGATPRKGGKGPARSCSCSESPPCPCSVVLVCYLQTQARMKVSHNCARRGRKEGGGVRACRGSLRRRLAGREGRDAGVRACTCTGGMDCQVPPSLCGGRVCVCTGGVGAACEGRCWAKHTDRETPAKPSNRFCMSIFAALNSLQQKVAHSRYVAT